MTKKNPLIEPFVYILKNKDVLKQINMLKSFHIAERLFLPLYIFWMIKNFVFFSCIISVSLLSQILILLLTGYKTDKNILITNFYVSAIRIIESVVFIFIRNPFLIGLNKIAFDNTEQIYDVVCQTANETIIKKTLKNQALLSCVNEMCLCFSEVILFNIFALIALLSESAAFISIFVCSIFATIIMNRLFQKSL